MPLSSAVAAVFAAAVLAAGVACAVRVVVMVAARLGVIAERAVEQRLHRRASEDARLNAAEAANAARLAAKGTAERAAELLQLEQLAAELQARSEEMQAQLLRTPRIVGPRRMLRAYPKLRHGSKLRSLPTLREMLHRAEQENKDDNKNTK